MRPYLAVNDYEAQLCRNERVYPLMRAQRVEAMVVTLGSEVRAFTSATTS
jgi:hypothetical protein